MATASRQGTNIITQATLTHYVERALEFLWLFTAALVPLIFVPTDFMLSEAVNAYVEIPKTTALRTLVGIMTILWIVEWVLKGGLSRGYSLAHYLTGLKNWLEEQPSRWVVVAATVYVIVAIITTFLSLNFYISVWGEVSGQFGYSAYTTVSYFLLFAIIATHLKTRARLWRLLGVMVFTGTLVALYGILQHYNSVGLPIEMGESGTARVSSTMANSVFAGAALVGTTLLTIGVGLTVLDKLGWRPWQVAIWVVLVAVQFMAVYWTGARGSWLLGVPAGLLAYLALSGFTFKLSGFAKAFLIVASAFLITVLVVALTPSPNPTPEGGGDSGTAFGEAQERLSSLVSQATERGLSYRTDIWKGSGRLIVNQTWFEYEDLSLSFLRPLIGYGPELFKYAFPLESPLGGLLSHSHNFWIHHAVEQGILGFFSSLGLFIAFFLVGAIQLWRNRLNRGEYSMAHKWILVTLLATIAGRGVEMMVGVARESDLVMFWTMLAIFVVLPSAMGSSAEAGVSSAGEASLTSGRPGRPLTRRERRGGRASRRERRAHGRTGRAQAPMSPRRVAVLTLVSALVIFVGWLSWDKNIDYAWAAIVAADARDKFSEGQFQESQLLMSKAVSKAPDVPIYYNNLAGIYDSYRDFATNNPARQLPRCEQVFPLRNLTLTPSQSGQTYAACAEEAYRANLQGAKKNRTSPQAKLMLANSTLQLALMGTEGKADEAIRYYQELTAMIPASYPLYNALGTAYLRVGRPAESLAALEGSLALTGGSPDSAQALYLKALAYRRLNDTKKAIDSFEQSLVVAPGNPSAEEVRRQLVISYNALAVDQLQQQKAQDALGTLEKSLAITQGSDGSGTALYLQGVTYRQLNELQRAVDSLKKSLEVDANGPNVVNVHRQLSDVYTSLGDQALADEHTRLFEELNQKNGQR